MIARLVTGSSLLALALLASPAHADSNDKPWTLEDAIGNPDDLKISASIRARFETLHNQFRPGLDRNDDLLTFQTDIAVEYDGGPIRIGGELIDSRAYDGGPGSAVSTGEVNALEPVQAYIGADFGSVLGKGTTSTLDAGRFTLNLGSARLVGRNNFRNTTNAFTGVKFEWHGAAKERLVLFYTYPQQRLPSDKAGILDNRIVWDHEGSDQVFWGGFSTNPRSWVQRASISTSTRSMNTIARARQRATGTSSRLAPAFTGSRPRASSITNSNTPISSGTSARAPRRVRRE
jgi:hypothetical protein